MEIRRMEPRDIPIILKMHEDLVCLEQDLGTDVYEVSERVRHNNTVDLLTNIWNNPDILALVADMNEGRIGGYIIVALQPQFGYLKNKLAAYIVSLNIDKNISPALKGRILVKGGLEIKQWAKDKNAQMFKGHIFHANEMMRKAARKFGFRVRYLQYECEV